MFLVYYFPFGGNNCSIFQQLNLSNSSGKLVSIILPTQIYQKLSVPFFSRELSPGCWDFSTTFFHCVGGTLSWPPPFRLSWLTFSSLLTKNTREANVSSSCMFTDVFPFTSDCQFVTRIESQVRNHFFIRIRRYHSSSSYLPGFIFSLFTVFALFVFSKFYIFSVLIFNNIPS